MTEYPVRTRRWTRKEYRRLGELGILPEDEPVELLDGHLIVAEPKGAPHATIVALTATVFRRAFGDGWLVRQQDPIALDDASEPEPDVVVVPGGLLDYFDDHPARPVLVVEVAETSLYYDRSHKGSAYARAGLPDYWIVNLVDWRVEVYRRPAEDRTAELGWRYLDVALFAPGATIVPLARSDIDIAVSDILPEARWRLR
ncbi:MAG TPA: Uma2 family endonuclease [Candidatus Binatia bacterium]|nr:Uma2 family endonuclease [Candidatus Binatia bacterium]